MLWSCCPVQASSRGFPDANSSTHSTEASEIITNSVESGANAWGCADYLNNKRRILATGVTVNEYVGELSSHHKNILIDERLSIVGSYNLDMRSTYLDTEMMLVVDSEELNSELRNVADDEKDHSRQVQLDESGVISTAYGNEYVEARYSTGRKILHSILRVIILPFRYLL